MPQHNTPLWLEIKTEYLDANLDKVLRYLSSESQSSSEDTFYKETVSLLEQRTQELIDSLSSVSMGLEDESSDTEKAISELRILAACLLVQEKCESPLAHEAYFTFVKHLCSIVPLSYSEDLTEIALRSVVVKSIDSLGFTWHDIVEKQNFYPEVIANKLKTASFSKEYLSESWYAGKGSLSIKDGLVQLYCKSRDEAKFMKSVSSLEIVDDMISVQTAQSDRVKQSEEDNLEVMAKFCKCFISEQARVISAVKSRLMSYSPGDSLPVRYLGQDEYGNLKFESVDANYNKVEGIVTAKSNVFKGIYLAETIAKYLQEGKIIEAIYISGTRSTFSLEMPFLDALLLETVSVECEINAVLRSINLNKRTMTWWCNDGYPVYTSTDDLDKDYKVGDAAILYIEKAANNGYVTGRVERQSDEMVDEDDSRRYCVDGLLVKYENADFPEEPKSTNLSLSLMRAMCRLLFRYQKSLVLASERYRVLTLCQILAYMIGDSESVDYVSVARQYLKNLVLFASGKIDEIEELSLPEHLQEFSALRRRQLIIAVLKAYGADEDAPVLVDIIADPQADGLLLKLAKLVQSCNRIDDVYPAIKTVIKREITKFLSVETEDSTDFEEESGPNFGVENGRTEFKTSFFYAPGGAREQKQEKNIFRSLCSFLNTYEGGVLYLGVNDEGNIAGIDSDMEYMRNNVHGPYTSMDGYIRYIQDRMRDYFDLDVRINVHIDALYDGRVVAFRVDPYMHGVVELEGVAYIRNNNESVKMSQKLRRQMEAKKRGAVSESSTNITAIREAIGAKRVAVFGNYASSSSEEIRSRRVEPFKLICNNTLVWCYDLEDSRNKLFKLSRVSNVQICSESWANEASHEESKVDIFRFTGKQVYKVVLELDLVARNLLLEEFPDAEAELSVASEGKWLLSTELCSLVGAGRFYAGLASHIRIVEGTQFIEYARNYFNDALKAL